MTNILRGEVSVILNGVNYILRPTFEVLAYIETQIGKSLFTLLSQFAEKGITLNEQIVILKAGAISEAGEKINMNYKEIGEAIIKDNFAKIVKSVCNFIQKGLGF